MNHNVKIQSRRLYSPNLKNLRWIEYAQLTFLFFFQSLVCNFVFRAAPSTRQNLQTNVRKIRKIN